MLDNNNEHKLISNKAFRNEISQAVYKSFLKSETKWPIKPNKFKNGRKIPDHEFLRVGDIILTRHLDRNGKPKKNQIYKRQKKAKFTEEEATWTHVALYVGDYHLIESQGFKDFHSPKNFAKSGVQSRPITKYTNAAEVKVLRMAEDLGFDNLRQGLARYALLEHHLMRRRYGWRRVISGALNERNQKLFHKMFPINPNLYNKVICSEFILETFAIGASAFVKEYDEMKSSGVVYFPAKFLRDTRLVEQKLPMRVIDDLNA